MTKARWEKVKRAKDKEVNGQERRISRRGYPGPTRGFWSPSTSCHQQMAREQ